MFAINCRNLSVSCFIHFTFISFFFGMFTIADVPEPPGTWSPWTACSVTCGVGTMTRRRACPLLLSPCKTLETQGCAQNNKCHQDDVTVQNKVSVFERSHTTLRCPVALSQGTKEMYWINGSGNRIDQTAISIQSETTESTLLLFDVKPREAGTYKCVVVDTDGNTSTGDVALVVLTCASANPCHNGGRCVTMNRSRTAKVTEKQTHSFNFHCACPVGFSGVLCEYVILSDKVLLVIGLFTAVFCCLVISVCCCICWWWPHKPLADNEFAYHALPADEEIAPQIPSSDRLGHHGGAADVVSLQPSSTNVVQAAHTPAKPDVVDADERLLEHGLLSEGQTEPLVVLDDDHSKPIDKKPPVSKSVAELSTASSRQSIRQGEFPLTWNSIDTMLEAKQDKRTRDSKIQDGERKRVDDEWRVTDVLSRKNVPTRTVDGSIPLDSGKTTTSRASVSSSKKRLRTRKERTRERENMLDRHLNNSDSQPPQRSFSLAEVRPPLSSKTDTSAVRSQNIDKMRGPVPTAHRDADEDFLDRVPLSSPRLLLPLSPRQRDMADDAVLHEINSNRGGSRLSTPIRGMTGATSSSLGISISLPNRRGGSLSATHRLSADDDALWDLTHPSTPGASSPDHFNDPSVLAELNSRATTSAHETGAPYRDDVRVSAGVQRATTRNQGVDTSEDSASASLASRLALVDDLTGSRLVLPPPPPKAAHFQGNHRTQHQIQESLSATEQMLSADSSMSRTGKRLKFYIAFPKAEALPLNDFQPTEKPPTGIKHQRNLLSDADRHDKNPVDSHSTRRNHDAQHLPPSLTSTSIRFAAPTFEMHTASLEDRPVRPSYNVIDNRTSADRTAPNDSDHIDRHPYSNHHYNTDATIEPKNHETIEWDKLTGSRKRPPVARTLPLRALHHEHTSNRSSGNVGHNQLPIGTSSFKPKPLDRENRHKQGTSPQVEMTTTTDRVVTTGGIRDDGKAINAVQPMRSSASVEDQVPQKPSLDAVSSTCDRHQTVQNHPKRRLFSPDSSERHSYRPLVTQQELDQHFKAKRDSPTKLMASVRPPKRSTRVGVEDASIGTVGELRSMFENMEVSSSSGKTPKILCRAVENEEYDQWVENAESEGWNTVYEVDLDEKERPYGFHRTPLMDSSLVSPRRSVGCSDSQRDWSRTPPGGWSSTSPPRRWHVRTSPPPRTQNPENVTSTKRPAKKTRGRSRSPYVANVCFSNNTGSAEVGKVRFNPRPSRKVRKVKEKEIAEDDYKYFCI